MTLATSVETKNAALDGSLALLNAGVMRIYAADGTTVLSEHDFSATAFQAAAGGSATANPISSDTVLESGTATTYKCFASDGTTEHRSGDVGEELILDDVNFVQGGNAVINSYVVTQP